MNVEKEREFFDAFEARHGDYDVLAEQAYQRIIAVFVAGIGSASATTCVDLGCGTGAFTRRLGALGLDLTGVDISPRSIERARAFAGGHFVVGDVTNCALPSAAYDCAVMSGVLHHMSSKEVRLRSLREAHRMLKCGGLFFSYGPNGHSPSMWLYRHPSSPLYSAEGKTENEILLTRRSLESELREAGFTDINIRGLSGVPYRYVAGRLARRLLGLYNTVYEPLIRWGGFERYLGTFLVATARKSDSASAQVAK